MATSVTGKGTILHGHPLNVGVVGSYSARCANQVVSEADLVIYIGSHTGDQVTHNGRSPVGTAVVQIDIDPAEIGRSYAGAIGVVGDAKPAVAKLIARSAQGAPTSRGSSVRRHWSARGTTRSSRCAARMRPHPPRAIM